MWSLKYLWTIYIFVNVIKRMSKWFHQFSIIPTNGVDQYSWRAWNSSPRSLMMAHKSPLFIIGTPLFIIGIWVHWTFFRFNRIHQFTVLGTLRGSFCSTFFCTQGKFGLKGWRDHHCKWQGGGGAPQCNHGNWHCEVEPCGLYFKRSLENNSLLQLVSSTSSPILGRLPKILVTNTTYWEPPQYKFQMDSILQHTWDLMSFQRAMAMDWHLPRGNKQLAILILKMNHWNFC